MTNEERQAKMQQLQHVHDKLRRDAEEELRASMARIAEQARKALEEMSPLSVEAMEAVRRANEGRTGLVPTPVRGVKR